MFPPEEKLPRVLKKNCNGAEKIWWVFGLLHSDDFKVFTTRYLRPGGPFRNCEPGSLRMAMIYCSGRSIKFSLFVFAALDDSLSMVHSSDFAIDESLAIDRIIE